MSYNVFYKKDRTPINVYTQTLGSGGEGDVYRIVTSGYQSMCVKIYHLRHRTSTRESKIAFMVQNPPTTLEGKMYRICWPKEMLYDAAGKFVGFIMPLAYQESIQLYEIATLQFKAPLKQSIWERKFTRSTGEGLKNRLIICLNISGAVHLIHGTNKYIFVDFKPQNILVNPKGQISITDTDSIQISNSLNVLFRAQVATPEYSPKESVNIKLSNNQVRETWDRFSLAVVFYEVLFGLHPYVGTSGGAYSNMNTIAEKIQFNLYPLGSKRAIFTFIPKHHEHVNLFPSTVKDLFLRAFEHGGSNPDVRPRASEWGTELYNLLESYKKHSGNVHQAPKSTPPQAPPKPPSVSAKQPVNFTVQQNPQHSTPIQVKKKGGGRIWRFLFFSSLFFMYHYYQRTQGEYEPTEFTDSTAVDIAPERDSTVKIVFWKKCSLDNDTISVYMNGNLVGVINNCSVIEPDCSQPETVIFEGKIGEKYTLFAYNKSQSRMWSDEYLANSFGCHVIQIE